MVMNIRDQYHDPAYGTLYHLLQIRPTAAAFVKTAELDPERATALPDTAFAWPARRLFPIDTPENTVLSTLYREKTAAVPAEVDAELARAQDVYGVRSVIEQARKEAQTADQVKTAAAASEAVYLLPRLGRLRVKTAADVKIAEKLLLEQYDRLSMEDRAEGFINLAKVARDKGVALESTTHRMAGMTVCTTKVAADLIEARRMATKEPLFQQGYEKLAAAVRASGRETIQDRDELVTLADAVAKLDKEAGVDRLYDKKIPDAVQTVFNTEKVAEPMVDLAGRDVSLSKLAALPTTFWEDVVGKDLLRDITDSRGRIDRTKLSQVVPTLPRDLKLILKHQVP
jgi:hypothetical protein